MSTWVLIVFFGGGYQWATSATIDGFKSKSACDEMGKRVVLAAAPNGSDSNRWLCVERPSDNGKEE